MSDPVPKPRITIPLSQPSLGARERKYVHDALDTGWISGTGSYVARFEATLGAKIKRPHVTATSSGTTALEIVLQALGIGPGDEVIVPALTFAAPAAAVRHLGADPVLCDITEHNWTIDPSEAAHLLSPRTKALVAVDLMGHPCDYEALEELGVPIVEDAAQAHGAQAKGAPCGSFGVASVFSFHVNKAVTTGEGGAVATSDADLADRIRLITNHGMRPERPYHHEIPGRNGRMTNIAAAIGCAQVERWDELVGGRVRVGQAYDEMLAASDLRTRPLSPWAEPSCWLHTFSSGHRDRIVDHARARGVDVRAIWPALSTQPAFGSRLPRPTPIAEAVARCAGWLPTWSDLDAETMKQVMRALGSVHTQSEFR